MNTDIRSTAKILIVDDTPKNLQVIATILSIYNYQLAFAKNGQAAIDLCRKIMPDLILMDIMMPELNGLDACLILKKDKKTQDIPIVFITAKTDVNDIVKGFQCGGSDYITKPFNKEELLARITNQLEIVNSRRIILKSKNDIEGIIKTQDRLYSIISHDLKSPLNSIQQILRMVEQERLDPNSSDFTELIHSLSESTKKTSTLLENLLLWTKNKAGSLKPKIQFYSLVEMMNECVDLYELALKQKELNIRVDIPKDFQISVDKEMIQTVFRNFISNAIKFSFRENEIKIYANNSDNLIKLHIQDQGIGVDTSIIEKMFKETHIHTSRGTEEEKGSGFGLLLSKSFIDQNNAKLKIESEPKKGCHIILEFPTQEDTI